MAATMVHGTIITIIAATMVHGMIVTIIAADTKAVIRSRGET